MMKIKNLILVPVFLASLLVLSMPISAKDDTVDLGVELAETWMKTVTPAQNAWSWDAGVLMMGFLELTEVTGDDRFYQYAKDWIDHHIEVGYAITSSDSSIPGFTALALYEREGDPRYLQIGHEVWQYISEKASRTSDGGLNHLGLVSGNQIWVDSLFMIGPFLLRYAELMSMEEPLAELALQFNVFRLRLKDEATGLYRHMYDDDKKTVTPEEPLFWGRGNGWVFYASQLTKNSMTGAAAEEIAWLAGDSEQMYESLASMPTVDGRFHTIVNAPESYLETSAGLLYAFGLYEDMRLGGSVDEAKRLRADEWIRGAVKEITTDALGNTLLLGTSYGTSPGSLSYYNQVLKGENVAYGIGAYLLAVTARDAVGGAVEITRGDQAPTEFFVQPPVPCEGAACGKFHMARGNFILAKTFFNEAAAEGDSEAYFYNGLIDLLRFGFSTFYLLDEVSLGDAGTDEITQWLAFHGRTSGVDIAAAMDQVAEEGGLATTLERIVILENGGHLAIGGRELDTGEVYLFKAAGHLLQGVGWMFSYEGESEITNPEQDWLLALAEINLALGDLSKAIWSISRESDDQLDDLVPANLFALEGEFLLPGVLEPINLNEAAEGLPSIVRTIVSSPIALIAVITLIQGLILAVSALLGILAKPTG